MNGRLDRVEPHPRDPNYRRLFVADRAAAQLTVSEVEELGLEPGDAWNAKTRARIERVLQRAAVRSAALKILGRRAMAKATLREKLLAQDHDEDLIDDVIDALETEGWIDDASFAEAVVHDLTRSRPAGAKLVRQRLEEKGVDAEAIEQAVADLEAGDDPIDAAFTFAKKQMKKMARVDARTAARRLAGQLHRRGFEEDIIQEVIDRLGLAAHDQASFPE